MEDFNIDDILDEEKPKEKEKGKDYSDVEIQPIKAGKIVCCVLVGIICSFLIFLLIATLYTNYIRFPAQEEIIYEQTGMYALSNYEDLVHEQKSLGKEDYLVKELEYANNDADKLSFIKKIVNTLQYKPNIINAKNIYGNDMIDKNTMQVVTIDSSVVEGEEVNITYVDYKGIEFNEEVLKNLISKYELTKENVNYANVLVNMFCEYIYSLEEIPVKTISRAPCISKVGEGYVVLEDEDVYLDQVFFSSEDFIDCEMRFTEAVGKIVTDDKLEISKEWEDWNKLSEAKKEAVSEPLKYGKLTMSMNWCGAYYLQNNYYTYDENGNRVKEPVKPQLGDGTFESPASIGTSVLTSVIVKDKVLPIRVELVEFGVSEKAISWFQSKHIQNRGYNLESQVQYCYSVFKVTNLSSEKVTVNDNASLCDKNGNLSTRTGTVFGLAESITLQPDETGYIESWGRSTELNRKYLIWGADFEKKIDPVWFRVLAGDLEDKTEDKGVYIIKNEKEEETEVETETTTDLK